MQPAPYIPKRPLANTFVLLIVWVIFYGSFTLYTPALLDDADSVHAEVAREMLLHHDWITLHVNGIRYLEKAPLLYWSMAASFKLFGVSAAAARIPLALMVLALALMVESFARRAFCSVHAGLYAALILLSGFGVFLFTRILLPDGMLCLWLTLAMLCFWLTDEPTTGVPHSSQPHRDGWGKNHRLLCYTFAACCALGILTKGLIGVVFPVAIVLLYLMLTRGVRGCVTRIGQLHPLSSSAIFLTIAVPWHILAAVANPAQENPGGVIFAAGHWQVLLPTQGNVHGWLWFYFVNEQLLRYLNLRVPRDYDTVPLWLFWGLCLVWLMPWSAFLIPAMGHAIRACLTNWRDAFRNRNLSPQQKIHLLLVLWAAIPLVFFSFSTRQEYYVLPALPALAILIAGWLALDEGHAVEPRTTRLAGRIRRVNLHATAVLLTLGSIFATAAAIFLLRLHAPASNADLAALLQKNPADYTLSMGHFFDLNAQALALFRLPITLAALSILLGPICALILRKKNRPHAATLSLAAGAFGFLLAAHLALQIFAPVLSSRQLAEAIAPQIHAEDIVVIHQEYEFASTLGFYLRRDDLHILEGRSSDLWYGSFFPDAPPIFETPHSLSQKWQGPQRIFVWQDLGNQPSALPAALSPVYVIVKSGGKEIVSNQSNR